MQQAHKQTKKILDILDFHAKLLKTNSCKISNTDQNHIHNRCDLGYYGTKYAFKQIKFQCAISYHELSVKSTQNTTHVPAITLRCLIRPITDIHLVVNKLNHEWQKISFLFQQHTTGQTFSSYQAWCRVIFRGCFI